MWLMVRTEVEISTGVGGRSVDVDGHRHILSDDQNILERNNTGWLYFHGELDGKP
jgi:hypothetical protein